MIIANSAPHWLSIISYPTRARRIIVNYHLIPKRGEWNNFINSNQEICLDLVDFALQEQPEDNLIVSIFRA